MKEAVHGVKPGQGPNTHSSNTKLVPIDGIWHTPEIQVRTAAYLPFDLCLGDHRLVVVDFSQASILGVKLSRVVAAESHIRNLETSILQQLEIAEERCRA